MKRAALQIKKLQQMFFTLSKREQWLIGFIGVFAIVYASMTVYEQYSNYQEDFSRILTQRERDIENLDTVLTRYTTLNTRLTRLQKTFDESQMTFEQVTTELDKIVKESIGSDNYDLKKTRAPGRLGVDYEKQDFTLSIKSLTLAQLVELLYQLDHGSKPMFLGRVDITRSNSKGDFSASLEIYSIRKDPQQVTAS